MKTQPGNLATIATAVALVLATAGVAAGQAEEPPAPAQRPTDFNLMLGGLHLFETDIDGGGKFDMSLFQFRFGTETGLSPSLRVTAYIDYELDLYGFSGMTSLGVPGDPWDDIHTLNFGGQLLWSPTNDWVLSAGPLFEFSRESGADWGDSLTIGGTFAATHIFSPDLILGAGLLVKGQIEDDPLLVPIIVLDWKINERFSLVSTQTKSAGAGLGWGPGFELVYDTGGHWELAVGGKWWLRRFRLDDDAANPEGAGENSAIPFWGRASYKFNESVQLDLYAGVMLFGKLQNDDSDGNELGREDYDPAPVVGLSARIRF